MTTATITSIPATTVPTGYITTRAARELMGSRIGFKNADGSTVVQSYAVLDPCRRKQFASIKEGDVTFIHAESFEQWLDKVVPLYLSGERMLSVDYGTKAGAPSTPRVKREGEAPRKPANSVEAARAREMKARERVNQAEARLLKAQDDLQAAKEELAAAMKNTDEARKQAAEKREQEKARLQAEKERLLARLAELEAKQ